MLGSGLHCWQYARRSPGRLLPGKPTCTPGQGHAAPTPLLSGQPVPVLSQAAHVLPPHSTAVGAGEAPQACHRLRGSPPHRHVGQAPSHRLTRYPLGATGLAERMLKPNQHAAFHNDPPCAEVPPHRGQSQGAQTQEGRQIKVDEGSLRHVEVSLMECVATPIIGGPTPTQATTHPPKPSISRTYDTRKHEEPENLTIP